MSDVFAKLYLKDFKIQKKSKSTNFSKFIKSFMLIGGVLNLFFALFILIMAPKINDVMFLIFKMSAFFIAFFTIISLLLYIQTGKNIRLIYKEKY